MHRLVVLFNGLLFYLFISSSGSLEADSDLAPSLLDLGKVRLHVGDAAPITFFVSRNVAYVTGGEKVTSEMTESEMTRMVQLTSNTVSAAFYQGATACHVSMAGKGSFPAP
jgi:hypothetical protein